MSDNRKKVKENGSGLEHYYLNSKAVKGLSEVRVKRQAGDEGQEMLTFTQKLSNNVTRWQQTDGTQSCHHKHNLRILEELLMDYDQTERPPSKGWCIRCCVQCKSNPISVQAQQMLKWASWSEAWDPYQILTWWVVMSNWVFPFLWRLPSKFFSIIALLYGLLFSAILEGQQTKLQRA